MHVLDILIGSVSGVVAVGIVVSAYHGILFLRESIEIMIITLQIKKISSQMKILANQEMVLAARKRLKDIYADTNSDDGYDLNDEFSIEDEIGAE